MKARKSKGADKATAVTPSPTGRKKAMHRSISPRCAASDYRPTEAERDYVAYHSAAVMGCQYMPPEEHFHFFSRKPKGFLRRAIGCRVWVVAGARSGSRASYRLAGVFTPSAIRQKQGGFGISGRGIPFPQPLEITTLPWFVELCREQNRFSYGFSRIRSTKVVAELRRILQQRGSEAGLQPDEFALPSQFFEGATRQVFVNRYERNPCARQQCIQHHGCRCSVCGFDFEASYGVMGRGFIQVHHLKPLSEIGKEYEIDPVADLRPICPNCHAMIHREAEMTTIERLKEVLGVHATSAKKTKQQRRAGRFAHV